MGKGSKPCLESHREEAIFSALSQKETLANSQSAPHAAKRVPP